MKYYEKVLSECQILRRARRDRVESQSSMTSLASLWGQTEAPESLWAIEYYAINVSSSLLCLRELPNSENTIILDKEVTQMNYNENYIM